MSTDNRIVHGLVAVMLAVGSSLMVGCQPQDNINRLYENPYGQPRMIAVTVFSNLSGASSLDPVAMTDEFYTELQLIDGFQVVPINRVLAAMNALELAEISSPTEAVDLAGAVNADVVIVGAVTRYDPYFKPSIGVALQLYDREQLLEQQGHATMSSAQFKQQAQPFSPGPSHTEVPANTVVRIIDCDRSEVIARLQEYASGRSGKDRPDGWKYYTRNRNFLRFASYDMIGELLAREKYRMDEEMTGQLQPASFDAAGDDI